MTFKATKKPVEIEAIQLTKNNTAEVLAFVGDGAHEVADGVEITTLEGAMLASWGDYVIKGVKGEFYPCKPDIFEATYAYDAGVKPRLRSTWRYCESTGFYELVIGELGVQVACTNGDKSFIEMYGYATDLIGLKLEEWLESHNRESLGRTDKEIMASIDNWIQIKIDELVKVIEA